ncbi:hypothetical protein MACK_002479 [Theileria orientalis]|uniref:SfiI-subtelomeric related protein family member n=1 Tax=Theileria orientalis TaxID=68886 RepID=A0A976QUC5_THEOR|nr:hypothetical protein MACK_002479 [Theileria orientalis]
MIDTISTYILVYLLTCVRINVYVSVKADGGQTSSSSQRAETQSGSSETHTSTPKNGVDLNIKSDTKTTNKYDYKKVGEYVTYTAKDNNAFKLVKDDKTQIWKETNANNYSTKVEVECLASDGKAVTVCSAGDNTMVFKKSGKNEPWSEIDTTKLNPMPVNVSDHKETYFYSNKLLRSTITFEAHYGFGFNVVTETIGSRKVEIWKTSDPNEYAKIVEYTKLFYGKLDLTLHLKHGKKYFIKEREDEGWKEIDITKVNPKPVNIQDRYHSCFYTYSFNKDVRTFTAKTGFLFNRVKDGTTYIWSTGNENEYAMKVLAEGNKKVIIYTGDDGNPKVFIKASDNNWTEDTAAASSLPSLVASYTQPKVKLFKVNPSDAANPLELDANEYTSTQSGNVVTYQIAGCVNCVKLMFDDVLFWQHDPNQRGGKYPKSLDYDKSKEMLVLKFEGLDITFAKNYQGGWIFTESGPLAVKFHVVDPNDSSKTIELASNQLTVTTNGDVTTFNIAEDVNSIALTYGPALLWQHDQNQRGGKYPKSLYYSETNETLVLRFDGFYLTFAKNDQGQWEYTETTSGGGAATTPPVDPSGASKKPEVKLFKVNPSDAANPLELDANEYTSTQSGNVVTYQIAGCVNCVKLMFDDVLFWQHDPNQRGGKYPKSLDYDKSKEMLVLKFEGLDITFAKNYQGGWIFTESGPLAVKFHVVDPNDRWKHVVTIPRSKTIMDLKTPETLPKSHYTASTDTPESLETSEEAEEGSTVSSGEGGTDLTTRTDSDLSGTSSSQQSSGYTLDVVTTSHDNTKYDFETKNNDIIFTFKSNVNCSEVKCNNFQVWNRGDQNISEPKSVVYNSNDNQITVRDEKSSVIYKIKTDGTWYHFTTVNIESDVTSAGDDTYSKQPESSQQPDQDCATVVTSPQQTSTSPDKSSSKHGDGSSTNVSEASQPESGSTHTSGTGQVLLSSIYPTGAASSYDWDTDSHGSSGSSNDTNEADGSSKSSGEPSESSSAPIKNNQQSSSTSADSSSTQTKKTPDGSGSASTDQSDSTPPSVPSGRSASGQGARTGQSSTSTLTVPAGQTSTQAPKTGSQQVSSGQGGGACSDGSVSSPPPADGGSGTLVQGATSTLPTAGGTDSGTKTGVELSLKATAATNEFDHNKVGNIVTYTAKDNYAFKSVKTKKGGCSGCCGSDVTIWDAKDPKEYASKVVLHGKGKKEKVLTIHLANDSKKVFRKNNDNSWKMDDQKHKKSKSDSTKDSLLKIYTKDPNDPSKTIELDHSEIKPVGDKGDNKLYKYEFGDQVECTEVKYSDESVWKHDNQASHEHPKFIFYHELVKIVFVEVPKDTFQFYRKKLSDKKWTHEQLKSTDKVDKDKVKLYNDSSGKTEIASDKYSVKEFPFGFEFALKEALRDKKDKSDTATNEIIWSFHLDKDSDLKIKGTLDDIINVDILKKEDYSVGGNNANVNSLTHDFPNVRLSGWTHTYQHPLRIRKFVVGSKEVPFSKISPISGFTVFNTQDLGDFVTFWHDGDFHHYSKTGVFLSKGAFPFANGDKSIHPNVLNLPTILPEVEDLTPVYALQSDSDDKIDFEEVSKKPEPEPLHETEPEIISLPEPEPEIISLPEPEPEIIPLPEPEPEIKPEPETKPEPELLLNGLYPDFSSTDWSSVESDVEISSECDLDLKPDDETLSGWEDYRDPVSNTVTFVNILPEMGLSKDDLVLDLSVITLATEDTPYKIIQGDDEMIIRKFKIDNVFMKYSCSLTNERSFKPQIRHFLSNFQLDAEDVSKFELYVGEYDEPLLIRLTDPSGVKNFVHRGKNKWETLDIKFLDINTLDQNYILLRDDITMIDCSKKSGHYLFGKYKIQVNELEAPNQDRIEGFKTYIHTIYHQTDTGTEFSSPKVHRFKYDTTALGGFVRYHSVRKVCVHFWKHELTRPVYIRVYALHGFGNYFGYPNYTLQTNVSMIPYSLRLTNFEVNNALAINLARFDTYDFEGGISVYLTRHQIKVKPFNNTPINSFKKCIHTLTVGGVNKQFNILRFINEPSLKEVITNVSSLEAYFHNKHINKPLMFIVNESSKQRFYKLHNDNYVKMDNLIIDLENTLKYLAYLNYNYVTVDISKSSSYHPTGASDSSLFPDSSELVSVVKQELNEFSKFTHSVKVNNNQSKFKLIALDGVSISIVDRELTSVDCYFFNEHNDTPLLVVLRGDTDVVYTIKKSQPIKNDANILSALYYNLRKLVKFNFGLMYLRLDQTSNYYSKQDDGLEIQVIQDGSVGNYAKYIHNFPEFSDIRFLVGDTYYRPKIDPPGSFTKALVYKDARDFPQIVSLIDVQEEPRYFIHQDNMYKRAKKESVDRKLGINGSQVQTGGNGQS